jgi:glycosyltransferase involved in cell wall biosynthesis
VARVRQLQALSAVAGLSSRRHQDACRREAPGAAFDLCTATTRAEWQTLEDYGTGAATDWFPNGVDADFFSPDGRLRPDTISFIGRMDYYPNQECMSRFCAQIWPLLQGTRPQHEVADRRRRPVARDAPPGRVARCDGHRLGAGRAPFIRQSALMVAPLNIARGTQNKILEAMAMGVPVVTSSIAAGGVDAEPVKHFLVADTPQEYSDAICACDNPVERQRLAVAGRQRMLSTTPGRIRWHGSTASSSAASGIFRTEKEKAHEDQHFRSRLRGRGIAGVSLARRPRGDRRRHRCQPSSI